VRTSRIAAGLVALLLPSVLFGLPAASAAAATPAGTVLQATTAAQQVGYGGSVAISARLLLASTDAPLAGGRVYLQHLVNGWVDAGSVVTNANGTATAYATGLTSTGSWALYWPGNASFAASRSATVTVTVGAASGAPTVGAPKTGAIVATLLTATATTITAKYGGAAAFSARLTRASSGAALPGGRVYLQEIVNGAWANAGSVLTNGNGVATAYAVGLTSSRTFTLFWPGNATFPAARTVGLHLVVTGAPVKAAPLRLTFYYPWFPDGLDHPGSNYTPSDGAYSTADPVEDAKQISQMRFAGLNGAIFSWEGQSDAFSKRLSIELAAAHGTPFRWSVYYELEGQGDPSVAAISSDLNYLYTTYASDPNWLRIDNKPVIFVWNGANDGCAMLARWAAANANHQWYVVQKEFFAQPYRSCANQPDAWHEYAPANQVVTTPWSFSVSPGFWRKGEATPQLARSVSAFDTAVKAMKASNAQFEMVTTWNEWIEGTSIQSATAWATPDGEGAYVDVLHNELGSQ
jgi:hypothetical protein